MRFVVLFLLLFLSLQLRAQSIHKDSIDRRNVIKLNIASLAVAAINFQYERKVDKNTSVALGILKRFERPIFNYLDRRGESPLRNIELSSFALTPEVKVYFKGEALQGLYVGAYLRWRRDDLRFQYRLDGLVGIDNVNFDLEDRIIHAGFLLGYQLNLTRDVYVDFWLVGIGLRYSQIEGDGDFGFDPVGTSLDNDIFSNINGIFNREFNYKGRGQEFQYVGESLRASFRGVGVCVGIRF